MRDEEVEELQGGEVRRGDVVGRLVVVEVVAGLAGQEVVGSAAEGEVRRGVVGGTEK